MPGDVGSALSVQQPAGQPLVVFQILFVNCKYQRTAVTGFERFAAHMANDLNSKSRVNSILHAISSEQGRQYRLLAVSYPANKPNFPHCQMQQCLACRWPLFY
jgi:hypothetical protein